MATFIQQLIVPRIISMYGKPMKIPSELVLPRPKGGRLMKEENFRDYLREHFVDKLWRSLNHVQRLVKDNLKRATELQKGRCNHGVWSKYYPGQGVWLRFAGRNSSFEPYPYAVINVLGDVLCKVQRNVYSRPRIVHCGRLEPMERPYDGQWVFGLLKEKGQSSSEEYLDGVSNLFIESKRGENMNPKQVMKGLKMKSLQHQEKMKNLK